MVENWSLVHEDRRFSVNFLDPCWLDGNLPQKARLLHTSFVFWPAKWQMLNLINMLESDASISTSKIVIVYVNSGTTLHSSVQPAETQVRFCVVFHYIPIGWSRREVRLLLVA